MKILVLINNNLLHDTRVKRHVQAMSERADAHVLARPVPDKNFYLGQDVATHSWMEFEPRAYPSSKQLVALAKTHGFEQELLAAAPLLAFDDYYQPEQMQFYKAFLTAFMEEPRWRRIRQEEDDIELLKTVSYTYHFIEASVNMADAACRYPADVVYCNDIDTLLAGVAHKKKYGSQLVYDVHDLFYGSVPGIFPVLHSYQLAFWEAQLMPCVDTLLSVGKSILHWMEKTHRFQGASYFIPNCAVSSTNVERSPYEVAQPLRLYYHGAADGLRGIDKIIQAVRLVEGVVLKLRCLPSEMLNQIKMDTQEEQTTGKIEFLAAVSPAEIASVAAADGDIGIVMSGMTKPYCVTLDYSLNNKFIEYLQAGLPIITYPAEEQAEIVQQYQCGFVLKDASVEDLVETLEAVKQSVDALPQMSANALLASEEVFAWGRYKPVLWEAVADMARVTKLKATPNTCESDETTFDAVSFMFEALEKSFLQLTTTKNMLQQEIEQQKQQAGHWMEVSKLYEAQVKKCEAQVKKCEAQAKKCEAQAEELKHKLYEIENSKIWKMTAALRKEK